MGRKLTKAQKQEFRLLMRGGLLAMGGLWDGEVDCIGGERWEIMTPAGWLSVHLMDDTNAHAVQCQFTELPDCQGVRAELVRDGIIPSDAGGLGRVSHKWNHYAEIGQEPFSFAAYVLERIHGVRYGVGFSARCDPRIDDAVARGEGMRQRIKNMREWRAEAAKEPAA